MIWYVVRRLCVILLVLTVTTGPPVPIAQGAIVAAQAALAANLDSPMPEGCPGLGDGASPGADCPAVFCTGLPVIVAEQASLVPFHRETPAGAERAFDTGLSPGPDPAPPRPTPRQG